MVPEVAAVWTVGTAIQIFSYWYNWDNLKKIANANYTTNCQFYTWAAFEGSATLLTIHYSFLPGVIQEEYNILAAIGVFVLLASTSAWTFWAGSDDTKWPQLEDAAVIGMVGGSVAMAFAGKPDLGIILGSLIASYHTIYNLVIWPLIRLPPKYNIKVENLEMTTRNMFEMNE